MTMEGAHFKIDYSGSSYEPYGLFFASRRLFARWKKINSFKTRDEAEAFYNEIKNLPEWLR